MYCVVLYWLKINILYNQYRGTSSLIPKQITTNYIYKDFKIIAWQINKFLAQPITYNNLLIYIKEYVILYYLIIYIERKTKAKRVEMWVKVGEKGVLINNNKYTT